LRQPPFSFLEGTPFPASFLQGASGKRPLLLQGTEPRLGIFTHRILACHLLDPLQPMSSCIIVCGDNVFRPDILMQESRKAGTDPRTLLSRIHISRTVTIHQFHTLVLSRLGKRIADTRASLILLSGILPLFSDGAVPERESLTLFSSIMAELPAILLDQAPLCLIPVDRHEAESDRRSRRLFSLLESSSDSRNLVAPPSTVRTGERRKSGRLFGTSEN